MSEEIQQIETSEEQTAVRQEAKGKTYRIKVRCIVGNTNPRNPLSDELKRLGWTVFDGDKAVWPLAVSDNPIDRAKFVELMQAHDDEFCSWATTFLTQGQLQPIELRDNGGKGGKENTYTMVFGCRRSLAILYNWCLTGKPSEPVIEARLAKGSNVNLLHRAFVENERRNPSLLEEAESIAMAINAGCTEEEVARARGYSMSTIKNRLDLLNLEPAVQRKIREGKITATKALKAAQSDPVGSNGHVRNDSDRHETNGTLANGTIGFSVDVPAELKIKVRSKREITKAMDEYAPGTETYKALSWVLGMSEDLK